MTASFAEDRGSPSGRASSLGTRASSVPSRPSDPCATSGRLDRLVDKKVFPNRSQAIQEAVADKLARIERSRLARESAKLDPAFEKALADELLSRELRAWPEY